MEKRQVKAIAKAKAALEGQKAHTQRMIDAGQSEAAVQIARRLILAFEMKVQHLESGKAEKDFDIFAAGRAALAAFPSLQPKAGR
jgi:hypothetical protein